jgi:hypothetical protein
MNLYRQMGYANGTPEALDLAERLAVWHDAMVAHERRGHESACSDECPHADAGALWHEALAVLGATAHELTFLASRGMSLPPRTSASEAQSRRV